MRRAKRQGPAPVLHFAWRLLAALACTGAVCGARADEYAAAPWLLYRDANPFVAAAGLPFAPPAVAPERWRLDLVLDASNTELGFARGSERLVYDGEIHGARIAVTRAFGERWIVRATLGADHFGNGFLDSLIEDFHRSFGFSNGDRGRLGSDGHTIAYDDGSARDRLVLDRTLHALTPLLIDIAARVPGDGHEWLYGATLKLPIPHASPLIDDRSTDLSVWLAAQSIDAQARWPWGARIGFMQRANTRLLPERANDRVPFVDTLIGYRLTPRWDVTAQLQWHGAAYRTAIPFLETAATLALSTAWHSRHGWALRAGLVEDAIPRHAQDVTFFISLTL